MISPNAAIVQLAKAETDADEDRSSARDALNDAGQRMDLYADAKLVMTEVEQLRQVGIDPTDAMMILALIALRNRR